MPSTKRRVLIVDDEPQIRKLLRISLEALGDIAIEAEDATRGIAAVAREAPDIVLLDLGLPDLDGKDALRRIREFSDVPILILTARDAETEKVEALDAGADDYVTKPFSVPELQARMRTALRHRVLRDGNTPIIRTGALEIDMVQRRVRLDGGEIHLTPKEYDILCALAQANGRVLTHKMLLERIWGPAQANEIQYLRVYIRQLREKLREDPAAPRYIQTELGVGYRFLIEN